MSEDQVWSHGCPDALADGRLGWSRGWATGKAARGLQGAPSVFLAFAKDTQETQQLVPARK